MEVAMWDEGCDYNTVREIRVKTTAYLGVGAIDKIDDILGRFRAEGVRALLCVSGGHAYKATGAWDKVEAAAARHRIRLALYNKVTPNPTTESVDEAAALGRAVNAEAVLAIGGGSPIDCGKSAAILLANPGKTGEDLYCFRFTPTTALPVIAINLTHGTGSEVNRFAVATVTRLNYKPAIAYDCIYPRYAIDDPALMTGLSADQTRYVSIDAVNHVIEAATTTVSNPFAVMLARETVRLVHAWLPKAVADPKNLKARYELAFAAMQAGVAFDNGLLHFTHSIHTVCIKFAADIKGLSAAVFLHGAVVGVYRIRRAVLQAAQKGLQSIGVKPVIAVQRAKVPPGGQLYRGIQRGAVPAVHLAHQPETAGVCLHKGLRQRGGAIGGAIINNDHIQQRLQAFIRHQAG